MNKAITITPTENGYIVEVPQNSDVLRELASGIVQLAQEVVGKEIQFPQEAFDALPVIPLKPKTYVFPNYMSMICFLETFLEEEENEGFKEEEENEVPITFGE